MTVDVGSRWLLWKEVRVVLERQENRNQGQCCGGPAVLIVPEGRAEKKALWNDWVEEKRVERYGIPLKPGEEYVAPERKTTVEKAVEKARKTKVVTPERRLANRITSTRYRMKNPEKSRREYWTPEEIREMQTSIDAAVEELRLLKEARHER